MNYNLAELQEQFQTVKNDFFDCKKKLLEAAKTLGVFPENSDKMVSLTELESMLSTVIKAEEERSRATEFREQALIVLDRVLTVFHRDNSNFKPLLKCQETASKLQRQISQSAEVKADPESEALVQGNHAFSQLLKLIEGAEELDDDRLTELQDAVALSFERTLATAALRGKLMFGTMPAPEASTAVPVIENVSVKSEVEDTEKAIAPPPVAPPIAPPVPAPTMKDTENEAPPWEVPEETADEAPPWEVPEETAMQPPVLEPPVLEPPVVRQPIENSQEQKQQTTEPPMLEPPVVEAPVLSQNRKHSQEQSEVMSEEDLVELAGKKR